MRKKIDINTSKIGAVFLISVMTLAAVGVGYSAWTDTVKLET